MFANAPLVHQNSMFMLSLSSSTDKTPDRLPTAREAAELIDLWPMNLLICGLLHSISAH